MMGIHVRAYTCTHTNLSIKYAHMHTLQSYTFLGVALSALSAIETIEVKILTTMIGTSMVRLY